MSERRTRADAVLRAHGLDPAALTPERFTTTVARAGLGAADGAAFAEALGEAGAVAVATILSSLEGDLTDRTQRKMLRRALHRLRERGIAVPAPEAGPPSGLLARPDTEREAWLSAVDGAGTRLAWLTAATASGALTLVAAELNEPAGLTDLQVSEVARKQFRAAREHLRERGIALVRAPFEVADALVVEGQHRRGTVDRKIDYLRVRSRLTAAAPLAAAEPRSARAAMPSDDEIEPLVGASAALLTEPELALWWPHPTDAEPFLREIDELQDSPIVLSPTQQEGRLAAALARAAETFYPRPVVARRLHATAYVFAETGRGPAARMALAVAHALEHDPTGKRDVPLLAALTHQGLGRLAAARAAQRTSDREHSLVVTPGEALKDRSSGRPARTRS